MKKNTCLFSFFIYFLFILNCSEHNKVNEISEKFFSFIDQKDFKGAYELLSTEDKEIMSADSFYIFCYKREDVSDSVNFQYYLKIMEEFRKLSIFVRPINDSDYEVKQVQRIPDFQLISKIIGKTEDIKDFFRNYDRMKTQGDIPTKLDSSRNIKVIKEKGKYAVYIGLSDYSKYISTLKSMEEKELSNISIKPIGLKINKYSGFISPYLKFEIENNNNQNIEMFKCDLYIDKNLIEDDILIVKNLKSHSRSVIDEYIVIDKDKKDALSKYKSIFKNQIKIVPKWINFENPYNKIRIENAKNISGFQGFRFSKLAYFESIN